MNEEDFVNKAIEYYASKTGTQPSGSLSSLVLLIVRLENVNGYLADVFFDARTGRVVKLVEEYEVFTRLGGKDADDADGWSGHFRRAEQ